MAGYLIVPWILGVTWKIWKEDGALLELELLYSTEHITPLGARCITQRRDDQDETGHGKDKKHCNN